MWRCSHRLQVLSASFTPSSSLTAHAPHLACFHCLRGSSLWSVHTCCVFHCTLSIMQRHDHACNPLCLFALSQGAIFVERSHMLWKAPQALELLYCGAVAAADLAEGKASGTGTTRDVTYMCAPPKCFIGYQYTNDTESHVIQNSWPAVLVVPKGMCCK